MLQEDACQARADEQPGLWDQIPPTPKPSSSITLEDLVGIWQNVDDKQYLQLNEDGTYRVSSYIAGLEEYPFEVGQFRLEGGSFTLITGDESHFCRGQHGSYQVELTGQGQFHFELQEDACQIRISFQSGMFDPVSPASAPNTTQ